MMEFGAQLKGGKYKIDKVIGQSSFSVIYLATGKSSLGKVYYYKS